METRKATNRPAWAVWIIIVLVLAGVTALTLLMHQQAAAQSTDDNYGPSVNAGSGFSRIFNNQCSGANRRIIVWYPGGPTEGESSVSSVTVTGRYPNQASIAMFVASSTSDTCSRLIVDSVRVVTKDADTPDGPVPTPDVEAPDPQTNSRLDSDSSDGSQVTVQVSDGGFIREGKPTETVVTKSTTETVDGEEVEFHERTRTCHGGEYSWGTMEVTVNRGKPDEHVVTQYYRTGCIESGTGPPEGQLSDDVTLNDNQQSSSNAPLSDKDEFQELVEAADRPGKIYTIEVCNTHRRVDGRLVANTGMDSCNHEDNWKILRKTPCLADGSRPANNPNPFTGHVPKNSSSDTSNFRMGSVITCTQ